VSSGLAWAEVFGELGDQVSILNLSDPPTYFKNGIAPLIADPRRNVFDIGHRRGDEGNILRINIAYNNPKRREFPGPIGS
jgi:hypothetical protein